MSEVRNNPWLIGGLCLLIGAGGAHMYNQQMFSGEARGSATALDEERVKEIVRQVIADEPKMLVDSLQSMQARAQEELQADMSENLEKYADDLRKSPNAPKVGAENPAVTIVEFFDYHCGYCKRVTPSIARVLKEHKDVRVVFKEFPILSEDSQLAARAALAFSRIKPEQYFDFHTKLMEHRGRYNQETLNGFAKEFGVEEATLQEEMQAGWVTRELEETAKVAREIGVRGTPAMIIGDELIPGAASYEAIEQLIVLQKDANKE